MRKFKILLIIFSIGIISYPTLEILAKEITKSVNVIYFFPAQGRQNPSGSDPNWYYYWTDALGYTGQHVYDSSLTGVYGDTIVNSATSWKIRIGPASYGATAISPTGNRYINGYKAVVLHEFWHRDHRVYNYRTYGTWGNLPLAVDPDRDDIDNVWETMIGTNPNIWNSTEEGAEWTELHGTYGHESIDWAHSGSQWEYKKFRK